jgi:hypothetical protein
VQVYVYTILSVPVFDKLLSDFTTSVNRCDVQQTDLLQEFNNFIDHVSPVLLP